MTPQDWQGFILGAKADGVQSQFDRRRKENHLTLAEDKSGKGGSTLKP
jgi:hypothetical protein